MSDLATAVLTEHARDRIARRGIGEAHIRQVLAAPESVIRVRPGRRAAQKIFLLEQPPREYLIRVVVDVDRSPPEVVTAYRTSRVAKYRRV